MYLYYGAYEDFETINNNTIYFIENFTSCFTKKYQLLYLTLSSLFSTNLANEKTRIIKPQCLLSNVCSQFHTR